MFPGLTPDQQFQAGLFCGSVFATPTMPISPDPVSARLAIWLDLTIDSGGQARKTTTTTRRASPRATYSISLWATTIFFTATSISGASVSRVVNLTNKVALYNFLSTFSGTHYVTPRAISATVTFHF